MPADPPRGGSASREVTAARADLDGQGVGLRSRQAGAEPEPARRLAEPAIPGGRVEAAMGAVIRVLAHSPLARPVPAVTLSCAGLGLIAFTGLCATAPTPSENTIPVLLPLTALAHRLGAPALNGIATNSIMYTGISLCVVGLAMMLWANSRGWRPSPRRLFWSAAAVIGVLVNITPVGSSDAASYAAYGHIAALGKDPYVFLPSDLPGGLNNPYTALVGTKWTGTPSVYGPIATWTHLFAAMIGGSRPWLTIWVLMIVTAIAFLVAGYLLLRTAANPVRAGLIWVANPLLIDQLVMGGHLDAFVALAGILAILISRSGRTAEIDVAVGILIGVAVGFKLTAGFVALGIAVPLIRDRAWLRLLRTAGVAAITTLGLYYFSYGLHALRPAWAASKLVISPSIWRLIQQFGQSVHHPAAVDTLIGFGWEPLLLALAWYLYNRLSPDVPAVLAATCALTFAWVLVAPWSLPWYTSVAWVALALLPRNSLTRWLTLATGGLALLHFNGGHLTSRPVGPTP